MATEYDGEERVLPMRLAGVAGGALDDTAWDGTGDPASMVALLKGIYAQLAQIAENTTPAP